MKLKENKLRRIVREEITKVLTEANNIQVGSVVKFTKPADIADPGDIAYVVDRSRQDFDWEILLKKDIESGGTFGELSVDSDEIEPTGEVLDSEEIDQLYRGTHPRVAGLNKVDPDTVPDNLEI